MNARSGSHRHRKVEGRNDESGRKTSYIENVAAYIRVSTQEQKLHGISIEAQEEKLTEYADSHGMKS